MKGKIFNAQEVQSMIAGNKTQFREVIKFSKNKTTREFQEIALKKISEGFSEYNVCLSDFFKVAYKVGQKIFCKESFSMVRPAEWHSSQDVWYWAKGEPAFGDWTKPKPAQHMKQEHSRLNLLIKEIRVERLAEISEEDAIAEGCRAEGEFLNTPDHYEWDGITATEDFAALWDETHKKPEEKFEANPWVFVYQFELVR